MHKNRTIKGVRKEEEIRRKYKEWWLGKYTNISESIRGKIVDVEYYGNSVYGCVELTFDNGGKYSVLSESFRPRKKDLQVSENPIN